MPTSRIPFTHLLATSPVILGEGAVIERLRRTPGISLDPHVVNSAFVYDDRAREALAGICRQYLEIGRDHDLPLLLSTPTWRASRERIEAGGYGGRDLNGDNFRFLDGFISANLPQIKVMRPEATFLVWLDFREFGMSDREITQFLVEKAKVGLNNGARFGLGGDGFQRINIGCPRSLLKTGLERICEAFNNFL